MINLAVINKKDLIKYILKFTAFIIIIVIASNILLKNKDNSKFSINFFDDKNVTAFLNEMIPGIKELNTKEDKEKKENNNKVNPLEIALKMELGILDTTNRKIKEGEDTKNNSNENQIASSISEDINYHQLEQAKTRIKH